MTNRTLESGQTLTELTDIPQSDRSKEIIVVRG